MTQELMMKADFKQMGGEPEIDVRLAYIDNVWVRQMHFKKAGEKNTPHFHTRDHASLLAKGSARLTVNGVSTVYHAPAMLLVLKNYKHQFEALEDDTMIYCVHGLRDKSGSIIDADMIPPGTEPDCIAQYCEDIVPTYHPDLDDHEH